jgi:hypothetical protein
MSGHNTLEETLRPFIDSTQASVCDPCPRYRSYYTTALAAWKGRSMSMAYGSAFQDRRKTVKRQTWMTVKDAAALIGRPLVQSLA